MKEAGRLPVLPSTGPVTACLFAALAYQEEMHLFNTPGIVPVVLPQVITSQCRNVVY